MQRLALHRHLLRTVGRSRSECPASLAAKRPVRRLLPRVPDTWTILYQIHAGTQSITSRGRGPARDLQARGELRLLCAKRPSPGNVLAAHQLAGACEFVDIAGSGMLSDQ